MTAKKLARPVTVGGVEYKAGDTLAAEHADMVQNPKAFQADESVGNQGVGETIQFVQTLPEAPRATRQAPADPEKVSAPSNPQSAQAESVKTTANKRVSGSSSN